MSVERGEKWKQQPEWRQEQTGAGHAELKKPLCKVLKRSPEPKDAIRAMHRRESLHVESVAMKEVFEGQTVSTQMNTIILWAMYGTAIAVMANLMAFLTYLLLNDQDDWGKQLMITAKARIRAWKSRSIAELKSTVAKHETSTAHQQKQIKALTAGLQKVSAQVEMDRAATQMAENNLLTISAKPVGVRTASQPWIPTGERSLLQTHIATTESVSLCTRMKS